MSQQMIIEKRYYLHCAIKSISDLINFLTFRTLPHKKTPHGKKGLFFIPFQFIIFYVNYLSESLSCILKSSTALF